MITIEQIKESITLVDALERYTNIKVHDPNRRSISTKCPFHSDGKPSFVIYPSTNTFKCFTGCNEGRLGDVIDVVRLATNVDHKEAINLLINEFGIIDSESTNQYYRSLKKKREEDRIILEQISNKITEQVNQLKKMLKVINEKLNSIKTINNLERLGMLYHIKPQIEYWLDCISHENDNIKIAALKEVEQFFNKGGVINE